MQRRTQKTVCTPHPAYNSRLTHGHALEFAQDGKAPLPRHGAGKRRLSKPPSENLLLRKRVEDAYALQAAMNPTLSPILESSALHTADEAPKEMESEPKPAGAVDFPLIDESMHENSLSTSST